MLWLCLVHRQGGVVIAFEVLLLDVSEKAFSFSVDYAFLVTLFKVNMEFCARCYLRWEECLIETCRFANRNDGLQNFIENFVKNQFLPIVHVDYRTRVADALASKFAHEDI